MVCTVALHINNVTVTLPEMPTKARDSSKVSVEPKPSEWSPEKTDGREKSGHVKIKPLTALRHCTMIRQAGGFLRVIKAGRIKSLTVQVQKNFLCS